MRNAFRLRRNRNVKLRATLTLPIKLPSTLILLAKSEIWISLFASKRDTTEEVEFTQAINEMR